MFLQRFIRSLFIEINLSQNGFGWQSNCDVKGH